MQIVTRREAVQRGLKRYFTGKPCPRGHISERWTNIHTCIACSYERRAAYKDTPSGRQKHRDTERKKVLKQYGLTLTDYEILLAGQGYCCTTCGTPHTDAPKGRLHIDHCHSTGKVRGLLCSQCNTALGLVQDDVELLRRLAEYLEMNK